MKVSIPRKPSKATPGKFPKDKVAKKKAKDSSVSKKVLALASEGLPSPDKKKLPRSFLRKVPTGNDANNLKISKTLLKQTAISTRGTKNGSSALEVSNVSFKKTAALERKSIDQPSAAHLLKKRQKTPKKSKQNVTLHDNAISSLKKQPMVSMGSEKKTASMKRGSTDQLSVPPLKKKKQLKALERSSLSASGAVGPFRKRSKSPRQKLVQGPAKKSRRMILKEKHARRIEKEQKQLSYEDPLVLKRDLLEGVCSSILQLIRDQVEVKSGKVLFDSDAQEVYLQIQLFKVPVTPYRALGCTVPHPIYPENPEICLIVPDLFRGRRSDVLFAKMKETYEARLRNTNVKGIKLLLPFTLMRSEYHQFEMKRRLNNSYDLFLCDGRIFNHCSSFIRPVVDKPLIPIHAVEHYKSKKWIKKFSLKGSKTVVKKVQKEEDRVQFVRYLQDEVDKALRKVQIVLTPHGASLRIRHVGHSGFTPEQLADNIEAVWKALGENLPGGLENIHSAYVKGSVSAALPFFVSFTPLTLTPIGKFRDLGETVEDELSALPGRHVSVHPLGDIKVDHKFTEEDLQYYRQTATPALLRKVKACVYQDTVFADINEDEDETSGDIANPSGEEKDVSMIDEVAHDVSVTTEAAQDDRMTAETAQDVSVKKQKDVANSESDSDEDDDMIGAAEDNYLAEWSRSESIKELNSEQKKKDAEQAKKKKRKTMIRQDKKMDASKQGTRKKSTSTKLDKEQPKDKKIGNISKKYADNVTKKNVSASKKNVNASKKSISKASKKSVTKASKTYVNKKASKKSVTKVQKRN